MIARLCADRKIGPGFLVHDSHLFDGVDERQIAKALVIGANTAKRIGWQYIVTMNSDAVPQEFDPTPYIIRPRLTDATETGGLFGVRFGWRKSYLGPFGEYELITSKNPIYQ